MLNVRVIRFAVVGVIGFVVDGGGTWVLAHPFGVPAVLARVAPLLLSILVTWLLNRSLTFRVEAPRSRVELARYASVALTSAALNFVVYTILVWFGIHVFVAVALATGLLALYSFLGYRHLVFR